MKIAIEKFWMIWALALCGGLAFALPAAAQQTEDHFQRSFAVQPGGTLVVDNHKGLIRVTGSDSNQVVVNVFKKFEGSDKDRAWWMSKTQVHFTNSSNQVKVAVEYPNCDCSISDWASHSDYEASVELTIQVPHNINVDLQGHKPVMNISGINGNIHISSYKSPIEVQSTSGAIHIETYKETVQLKDVAIHGALDLQMAKGDASIQAKNLGDRVNLETEKGTIVLRAPQNTGMTLDYSGGRRSSFHSDFTIAAEAGSSSSIRGTINGGGTQVHLRSEKGSITLEKF
jgi:Putative adhesin